MTKKDLGIYIHIPFCMKKCLYCDFLSDVATCEERQEYLNALKQEIGHFALADNTLTQEHTVKTVFFGGGTPSILEPEQIGELMTALTDRFEIDSNAEITIECNPGTATLEKLIGFRKAGINRISIGLQSANDTELKNLGRIHNYDQFIDTYRYAQEAGFSNINVDLMSAVPGQTLESYSETLKKVIELRPQHISAYSLIIEEDTPFYDMYGDPSNINPDIAQLPDEDTEREMYYITKKILEAAGYHRYEISNYSLEGYECAHNKSYWTGVEYVGFGIGAAGYYDGVRYSNTSDFYRYISSVAALCRLQNEPYYAGAGDYDYSMGFGTEVPGDDEEENTDFASVLAQEKYHEGISKLSENDRMEEFMFLGLRMMQGVAEDEFEKRFHVSMDSVYKTAVDKLIKEQMLIKNDGRLMLSDRGIDVSNVVLANFLL